MDDKNVEYVWYACYGSNLSYERFMKYINRCNDKSKPLEDRPYNIPYRLYFALHSNTWNGAPAFLDENKVGNTLGRIYKVTKEQYLQIKNYEGSNYQRQINLGTLDNLPVYTFTNKIENDTNIPSIAYFKVILKGLCECYLDLYSKEELINYLLNNIMPSNCFKIITEIKKAPHYLTIEQLVNKTSQSKKEVITSITWLINHKFIKQDIRSINNNIIDDNSGFFTIKEVRELIQGIIDLFNGIESN